MSPQEEKNAALNNDRGLIFKVLEKEGRKYEKVLDDILLVVGAGVGIGAGVSVNKVECTCLIENLAQKTKLSTKRIIEALRADIKALAATKIGESIDNFLNVC